MQLRVRLSSEGYTSGRMEEDWEHQGLGGDADEDEEEWSRPVPEHHPLTADPARTGASCTTGRQSHAAPAASTQSHPRTIVHIDIDCFYAQVEMIHNPALREVPLGIQQKYLVVTCNYVARSRGVTKLMGVSEAKKRCPDLVLVSGEDLTRYREMSYKISEFLMKYTPCVERLGFDENFLDVTDMVDQRFRGGTAKTDIVGHVYHPQDCGKETEASAWRPFPVDPCPCGCEGRLAVGSQVVGDIRSALAVELGVTCCGGVGHNKLLAKLAGAQHKPNQQTTVLPRHAAILISSLPSVRHIPGIGSATSKRLKALGVETVEDLQRFPLLGLQQEFGDAMAATMRDLALGVDSSPVVTYSRPQTLSVEDSFRCCSSEKDATSHISHLISSLLPRVQEDGRMARTLRLTVRKFSKENRYTKRESRQCNLPPTIATKITAGQLDAAEKQLVAMATSLFHKVVDVRRPFHLTLINVAVARLEETAGNGISSFFTAQAAAGKSDDTSSNDITSTIDNEVNSTAANNSSCTAGYQIKSEPTATAPPSADSQPETSRLLSASGCGEGKAGEGTGSSADHKRRRDGAGAGHLHSFFMKKPKISRTASNSVDTYADRHQSGKTVGSSRDPVVINEAKEAFGKIDEISDVSWDSVDTSVETTDQNDNKYAFSPSVTKYSVKTGDHRGQKLDISDNAFDGCIERRHGSIVKEPPKESESQPRCALSWEGKSVDLPAGVDREVFQQLPKEIQQEILQSATQQSCYRRQTASDRRQTRQSSTVTHNSGHSRHIGLPSSIQAVHTDRNPCTEPEKSALFLSTPPHCMEDNLDVPFTSQFVENNRNSTAKPEIPKTDVQSSSQFVDEKNRNSTVTSKFPKADVQSTSQFVEKDGHLSAKPQQQQTSGENIQIQGKKAIFSPAKRKVKEGTTVKRAAGVTEMLRSTVTGQQQTCHDLTVLSKEQVEDSACSSLNDMHHDFSPSKSDCSLEVEHRTSMINSPTDVETLNTQTQNTPQKVKHTVTQAAASHSMAARAGVASSTINSPTDVETLNTQTQNMPQKVKHTVTQGSASKSMAAKAGVASSVLHSIHNPQTPVPKGVAADVFLALPPDIRREVAADMALTKHSASLASADSKGQLKSPGKQPNSILNYLRKR